MSCSCGIRRLPSWVRASYRKIRSLGCTLCAGGPDFFEKNLGAVLAPRKRRVDNSALWESRSRRIGRNTSSRMSTRSRPPSARCAAAAPNAEPATGLVADHDGSGRCGPVGGAVSGPFVIALVSPQSFAVKEAPSEAPTRTGKAGVPSGFLGRRNLVILLGMIFIPFLLVVRGCKLCRHRRKHGYPPAC